MSNAPHYNIDVPAFWTDPYPDLARMRKEAPIAFVPQLNSTVFTRRDDAQQKRLVRWRENLRVVNVPAGPAHYVPKEQMLPHIPSSSRFTARFARHQPASSRARRCGSGTARRTCSPRRRGTNRSASCPSRPWQAVSPSSHRRSAECRTLSSTM